MYGISTFCLNEENLSSALEKLAPLTDHIEVMDEGLHYLENAGPLFSYSTRFSIHAPCRGTNLASLLEPIRRASVEVMAQAFSLAGEVNASVVIHPGYFAWPQEREKAGRQLKKSLADLSLCAKEYSVSFFVENMGDWGYFLLKNPAELPIIGDAGFALDVGHAHQNHCLPEFLAHPARHYHIHDNDGTEDSHSAIGKGTIDFVPVIKTITKSGVTPVIEVATFDGVMESLQVLQRM
jgi:sugar phosphate isomerase/epimerase